MKKYSILILLLLVILTVMISYFLYKNTSSVEYKNIRYGFSIELPETWKGYSVTEDQWTGDTAGDQLGEVHYATGTVVSIHNPKWTLQNMHYQDIPIMVFTIHEWNDLLADKFHIGAAPINPTELGRNNMYVFALPARYNYAYPEGWEEVEKVLEAKTFKTF